MRCGQVKAGAIAAGEAVRMHIHLFTLNPRGESCGYDDKIRLAGSIHRVLLLLAGYAPQQTSFGATDGLEVFDFDRVRLSPDQMNLAGLSS